MTQCDRIIQYINNFGSISPLEAFRDLGITRLAARIFDIEHKGYTVERMIESSINRYGDKTSYVRYKLS